jgi:hypothetical protein
MKQRQRDASTQRRASLAIIGIAVENTAPIRAGLGQLLDA